LLPAATNRNVPAILWRDEHNHPEKLSHIEQCSNPYQTHTDNSLSKMFEPKFTKLFCAHSCRTD